MKRLKWAETAVAVGLGGMALFGQAPGIVASFHPLAPASGSDSGDGDRRVNAARKLIRESDDPTTGDRWLLLRDSSHPGGPGRWVLSSPGPGSAGTRQPGIAPAAPSPVIRPGDRLIVEQNSALIRARLEAVALGSAVPGSILNVRLQIGGGVFRAVALGPGRAAFEPAVGIEP